MIAAKNNFYTDYITHLVQSCIFGRYNTITNRKRFLIVSNTILLFIISDQIQYPDKR